MKRKTPVSAISAVIALAAALGLCSCKNIDEAPPAPDNSLPEPISSDEKRTEFTDNVFTYSGNSGSLFEISTEPGNEARAADPNNSDSFYEGASTASNSSDPDDCFEINGEPSYTEQQNAEISPYIYDGFDIPAGGEIENAGEITDISLTFYEISMNVGDIKMPIVTMYPEDAPDKSEIWESSDSSIADVDGIGNITAVSEGECTVTVRSGASPEVSAQVRVKVNREITEPTYIDGILIANKTYALPRDYNPGIDPNAQDAFDQMQADAAEEGLNIYISSGFRSYDYQAGLYERYVRQSGKQEADRFSARPGHSEHQSGLAFDLNSIDISFEDTPEYEWVRDHCADYGFIIRYPKDGEEITGYMYEPWHIRYLGKDTARSVYDSGLTLEEYLGIDSKYAQ